MTSGLFSGLEKAAQNPTKGWRNSFLSQPEEAVESSGTEEDEVLLISAENESKQGKYSGGTKRGLSGEIRNPSEYKAGRKLFKIPKVSHTNQTINGHSSGDSNPGIYGFDECTVFREPLCKVGPKGAKSKGFMIVRQGLMPGNHHFRTGHEDFRTTGNTCHRTRLDSPRPGSSYSHRQGQRSKINECVNNGPFGEDIEMVRNKSGQSQRGVRFKHADPPGCWRKRVNSLDANKDKSQHQYHRTDIIQEEDINCTHVDITEIVERNLEKDKRLQDEPINKNSIKETNDKQKKKTNGICEGQETCDSEDSEDLLLTIDKDDEANKVDVCKSCLGILNPKKICTNCRRDNTFSSVAKPRPPIHDKSDTIKSSNSNTASFYRSSESGSLKTYRTNKCGHAPVLTTKRRVSDDDPSSSSSTKSQTPASSAGPKKRGRPGRKLPLNIKEGGTEKSDLLSRVRRKKNAPAKPDCVLISSSDEEDNDAETSDRDTREAVTEEDKPSDKTQAEQNLPPEQEDTLKKEEVSKKASKVVKKGDGSNTFDRDCFTASITLGSEVMLGSLQGMAKGALEITADQLRWKMEYEEKDSSKEVTIFILGSELTSFRINGNEEPKIIVLGVTAALALKLRSKINGKGKFLDPGSAVSGEREIILQVEDTISAELLADLAEWVSDRLCKDFENLSVSEAEKILDYSKQVPGLNEKNEGSSSGRYNTRSHSTKSTNSSKTSPQRLIVYPPPPLQGGITVTTEDLECLEGGEFLNDVIIDFYLKYIFHEKLDAKNKERIHIFSSFFYKRLTQKSTTSAADTSTGIQERMHSLVKTWTRHVDIFKKNFIIVPINESSHWYLAIICFPGQDGPVYDEEIEDNSQDNSLESGQETEERQSDDDDFEEDVSLSSGVKKSSAQKTPKNKVAIKSCPCILVFDSLGGTGRGRVTTNLRNYLLCEWNQKKSAEANKDFSKESVKGGFPKVPEQDNHCDCGVFVLQYVESFFEDPITDYRMPIHKPDWFSQAQITTKRREIYDLVYQLKQRTLK